MKSSEYKNMLLCELRGKIPNKLIRIFDPFLGGIAIKFYDLLTHDYINEYIRLMRRYEYYHSKKGLFGRLFYYYSNWRWRKISVFTGITIPRDVCGRGLTIRHYGSIVINGNARIGRNLCISNNVNIGANKGQKSAPKLGDNVYIGPGACLFGDIVIADNCFIGANAVVNKSVFEPYSVVVGVPAKILPQKEKKNWLQYNNIERD